MTKQCHDDRGRFAAGNKGGPGNPFAAQVTLLRKAILECLTPENVQQIVYTLITMAMSGNLQAAKFLLTYAIGKPESLTSADQPSPNGDIQIPPPSPNGDIRTESPSPNGDFRMQSPSPNGDIRTQSPLPNGDIRMQSPSPNGDIRTPSPSPNGDFRTEPLPNGDIRTEPSPYGIISAPMNRKERRALKKAQRKAQRHAPRPNN